MGKIKVGLLFGGSSVEHEISVLSARNIAANMNPEKYEITLIGVDKAGEWRLMQSVPQDSMQILPEPNHPDRLAIVPSINGGKFVHKGREFTVDVIFTVCHGFIGEDGSHQGLMRCLNIPLVGSDIAGSVLGLDKLFGKVAMERAGVPIAKYIVLRYPERAQLTYQEAAAQLGSDLFIKPVTQGSSIGVSRVTSEKEFAPAVAKAFEYDEKILIEGRIFGREMEFALIGNDTEISVSGVGEVIPKDHFYTYESKYFDDSGAEVVVHPELPLQGLRLMQETAKKAFRATDCKDYARVDMFYVNENECYINEINTLPGFTNKSMFPKLVLASGMTYPHMVDRLIELALHRHAAKARIKTSV